MRINSQKCVLCIFYLHRLLRPAYLADQSAVFAEKSADMPAGIAANAAVFHLASHNVADAALNAVVQHLKETSKYSTTSLARVRLVLAFALSEYN